MPSQAMKILEESQVYPPQGTMHASFPLTPFDLPWVFSPPVDRLFFYSYPHPTTSFIQTHLPNLKSSLSLTLQHFYTLAGNLRRSRDDTFEKSYTDGDAVTFIVAESDDDFKELSAKQKHDFVRVHQLVPHLPASGDIRPLLAIQVTLFPGQGVCIGVVYHHVACDGSSFVRFLKSWASACSSGEVGPPPLYDPSLIEQVAGLSSMSRASPSQWPEPTSLPNTELATFTLEQDQIQRVKTRVVGSSTEPVYCSTFVVSCAYIWVCLVRARGYASDRDTHFLFSVDCRGRLEPPVPSSYFGNCLRPCFTSVNVGEIVGEGGFVAASIAIGKAIEELKDGVLKGAEGWGRRIGVMASEGMIPVAGSHKFRVYDTDFGWGRPERVKMSTITKTHAISLAETREDGRGIEIGLALEKHEMDRFQTEFLNGLKW